MSERAYEGGAPRLSLIMACGGAKSDGRRDLTERNAADFGRIVATNVPRSGWATTADSIVEDGKAPNDLRRSA
jgi:hypothetical protein